jgi:hypothetical protein
VLLEPGIDQSSAYDSQHSQDEENLKPAHLLHI